MHLDLYCIIQDIGGKPQRKIVDYLIIIEYCISWSMLICYIVANFLPMHSQKNDNAFCLKYMVEFECSNGGYYSQYYECRSAHLCCAPS